MDVKIVLLNQNNLVYTSMLKTLDKIGYPVNGIKINMDTNIPISRGLGSSILYFRRSYWSK